MKMEFDLDQFFSVVGLALDEEAVDYDLDSEDEEWLSVQSQERVCSYY